MGTPYLSEIRIMSFNYAPKGWAACNGQTLPINQNQALFALIGTYYGGDGRTNFMLPNLQGRMPVHMGSGFTIGQSGGEEVHTLVITEIPNQVHAVLASSNAADQSNPSGNFSAVPAANTYATTGTGPMSSAAVGTTGGGQPHENRSPYLVLNFCIALVGVFPSHS